MQTSLVVRKRYASCDGSPERGRQGPSMKDTARSEFRKFLETSSIKGLPRLIRSRGKCLYLMWIACVLFGTAMGSYQSYVIIQSYLRFETSTSVKYAESANITFPDVTVCKTNPRTTVEEGNMSYAEYQMKVKQMQSESGLTRDDRGILRGLEGTFGYYQNVLVHRQTIRKHLEFFMLYCRVLINGRSVTCLSSEADPVFLTPSFPACLTFHPSQYVTSDHGVTTLSVVFYMDDFEPRLYSNFGRFPFAQYASGIKVLIHQRGQFPNLQRDVPADTGMETSIQLHEIYKTHVPWPYSDCIKLEGDDPFGGHSQTQCINKCTQDSLIETCGCLDPDVPASQSERESHKYCGHLQNNVTLVVKRQGCIEARSLSAIEARCQEECPPGCEDYHYDYRVVDVRWPHVSRHLAFFNKFLTKKDIYGNKFAYYEEIEKEIEKNRTRGYEILRNTDLIPRNFAKINVYYVSREVLQYSDKPMHTSTSMTGALGSILNLWIGITFVTLVEVLELLHNLLWVYFSSKGEPHQLESAGSNDKTTTI